MHVIFYAIGVLSLAAAAWVALQSIGVTYAVGWDPSIRWWIAGALAASGLLWLAIGRGLSLLGTIASRK